MSDCLVELCVYCNINLVASWLCCLLEFDAESTISGSRKDAGGCFKFL